ncbi:MAG: class I SAM-dependent methyltransferase [Pirellula sp.]
MNTDSPTSRSTASKAPDASHGEIEVSGFETMADSMEFADNYNRWILSKFLPVMGTSLLEIGTGQGNFKKYVDGRVANYVSLDIDEKVIERARARDPKGKYEVADISKRSCLELKARFSFDSIICVNVLEHVPDHRSGLHHMLELLEPGGHLLLFVPSFMHLYNDLDRLAGHLRRYRKRDVRDLLPVEGGFELVRCEYFNPVGAVGWLANKFAKHKNINSQNVNSQVQMFDRYLVPLSRLLNPLTSRFWGQSLVCVIRKQAVI